MMVVMMMVPIVYCCYHFIITFITYGDAAAQLMATMMHRQHCHLITIDSTPTSHCLHRHPYHHRQPHQCWHHCLDHSIESQISTTTYTPQKAVRGRSHRENVFDETSTRHQLNLRTLETQQTRFQGEDAMSNTLCGYCVFGAFRCESSWV